MGLLKFFWGMNPAQNEFTFFGNFVTFFGVLFIRMKFSTFFGLFLNASLVYHQYEYLKKENLRKKKEEEEIV